MTVIHDPTLGFFADFVASEGGLHEERDGVVTCVVPDRLGRLLHIPEEVTVTADPAASREEGALLLAPGHPVIDAAADLVLRAADVGLRHVPAPAAPTPSLVTLLPRVREQLVVDHGRIDARNDAPASVRLPVVHAGALVTYDVTPEDRFHERLEVWVDATTGLEFPLGNSCAAGSFCDGSAPDGPRTVLAHHGASAVTAAHDLLEQRSGERLAELGRQRGARAAREGEAARTEAYYGAALDTLDSRLASAPPERQALLLDQADAVRAERARRLSEIDEKFDSQFRLRPFRLHLVTLPALALPLVARRGPRTWPLTVIWLTGYGRTLPLRCPRCGAVAPLVAGKEHLGCRLCLPRASLFPVAPAFVPQAPSALAPCPSPAPTAGPARGTGAAAARRRPGAAPTRRPPSRAERPVDVARVGDRLARDLWRTVLAGRRWPRRDLAPGSPLEALMRASGHRALLLALDLPEGLVLERIKVVTLPSQRGRAEVTTGTLRVLGMTFPFTMRWCREGSRGLPGELLPYVAHTSTLVAARTLPCCRWFRVGPPPSHLDPVARAFWLLGAADGAAVVARGLAAWWSAQAEVESLSLADDEAAQLIVEAVRYWPSGNVLVDHLSGPDWWAR